MYGDNVFLNIMRYDGIVAISLTCKLMTCKLMIKSNISALGDYVVNWVRQDKSLSSCTTPEIHEL